MSRRQIVTIGILAGVIFLVLLSFDKPKSIQISTLPTNSVISAANNNGINFYLPFIMASACQSYNALLEIAVEKDTLKIGDMLSITLTLRDTGCSNLGLLYYQIQPPHIGQLEEITPRLQLHYFSIAPDATDSAVFLFKANMAGQLILSGEADFEVHLASGPPLNGHAETKRVTITIIQP